MLKFFVFSALSVAAVGAQANDLVNAKTVTHYQYGMNLDISTVVNQTEGQDVNGLTPVQLTYKDSHGVQHILEYSTVSIGTSG
ncbi:MAG: DUF2790 domain-containing protein [Pseudomonas sp.]